MNESEKYIERVVLTFAGVVYADVKVKLFLP